MSREWNHGIMECWNNGQKHDIFQCDAIQTQYSCIPTFHHSNWKGSEPVRPHSRPQESDQGSLISLTFIPKVTIEPFCRFSQHKFSRGNLYGKTKTKTKSKTKTKKTSYKPGLVQGMQDMC